MSAVTATHSRGVLPSIHRHSSFRPPLAAGGIYSAVHDHTGPSHHQRPLTPPPEMGSMSHSTGLGVTAAHQSNTCSFGGYAPIYSNRNSAVPCITATSTTTSHQMHRNEVSQPTHPRKIASQEHPIPPQQCTSMDRKTQPERHSQRAPQASNAIAPSFQIPRSVNDSGGSLSELAARMACLFWFESSELLQQIEDSPVPIKPPRQLIPEAIPTTGFRKWVTTILSTTCVAQNVVILALLFVHRLKKLNPSVQGKPGSEYRLMTVALMLGNKFLDDNTYTNKTWADVSGINVAEVHVMEVEFLSNMKYCLFTSADDWAAWQSLLGRFSAFFDIASRPMASVVPAPATSPTSSLQLPLSLPSPPSSNHASPPYSADPSQQTSSNLHGPTPAQSPLAISISASQSRKRSIDDHAQYEPPTKRVASGLSQAYRPVYSTASSQAAPVPQQSWPTLPSLQIPPTQPQPSAHPSFPVQSGLLPPLIVPQRAIASCYGPTAANSQPTSQVPSRHHSPFTASNTNQPTPGSCATTGALKPPAHLSPTRFHLQHRYSPYRPVHHVSKLTCPPTTSALQQQPHSAEQVQMQYQVLSKAPQQQSGRLPYISQNIWLEGSTSNDAAQHAMTPVHQWPSFAPQRLPHPPSQH